MGRPLGQEQRWEGKAGNEARMGQGWDEVSFALQGLVRTWLYSCTMWEVIGRVLGLSGDSACFNFSRVILAAVWGVG